MAGREEGRHAEEMGCACVRKQAENNHYSPYERTYRDNIDINHFLAREWHAI